jgi:hypothetical protein
MEGEVSFMSIQVKIMEGEISFMPIQIKIMEGEMRMEGEYIGSPLPAGL